MQTSGWFSKAISRSVSGSTRLDWPEISNVLNSLKKQIFRPGSEKKLKKTLGSSVSSRSKRQSSRALSNWRKRPALMKMTALSCTWRWTAIARNVRCHRLTTRTCRASTATDYSVACVASVHTGNAAEIGEVKLIFRLSWDDLNTAFRHSGKITRTRPRPSVCNCGSQLRGKPRQQSSTGSQRLIINGGRRRWPTVDKRRRT